FRPSRNCSRRTPSATPPRHNLHPTTTLSISTLEYLTCNHGSRAQAATNQRHCSPGSCPTTRVLLQRSVQRFERCEEYAKDLYRHHHNPHHRALLLVASLIHRECHRDCHGQRRSLFAHQMHLQDG
ncbi:unnamed protein product, partial [Ectocarpus sp. 4 AP-2014]